MDVTKKIEFQFEDFLFLDRILIHTSGYIAHDFEVEWTRVDGEIARSSAKKDGDSYKCDIKDVITSVRFTPARTYLTDPLITSVQLFGFKSSEVSNFIDYASQVTAFADEVISDLEVESEEVANQRAALEALQATRGSLTQDIAKFKSQSATEQNKIKKLVIQNGELIAKNGDLERSIADAESRLEAVKSDVSRLARTRSSLARHTEEKRKALASLQGNINLFPSEISGFSDQGATNVDLYTRIASLPILIIAVLFVLLISGAADLSTVITSGTQVNIPALIVSRTPYVLISITIITACYYLARTFVLEIIRVNRQKLNLTKISVIAKDVSYALEEGLNLTDEEKYERRLRLKMDLMRDHLKDYLTKDFEPSLPTTISSLSIESVSDPSE